MTMIEQLTAAAIAELERQRGDGWEPYFDETDPSSAIIVGRVDLLALVRAVVKATGVSDGLMTWYAKLETENERLRQALRVAEDAPKLQESIATLKAALNPFANALDEWGDESEQPDRSECWEHPIAMCVTLGHFRAAKAALDKETSPPA